MPVVEKSADAVDAPLDPAVAVKRFPNAAGAADAWTVASPERVAIRQGSIVTPLLLVTAGGSLFVELPLAAAERSVERRFDGEAAFTA
jgi:hypothetical protein